MVKNKKAQTINPVHILKFLLREERRSSGILLIAAILALFLANSRWSTQYFAFVSTQHSLGVITLTTQHWISEGLMAVFFLVVTLEVKREFIDGELRSWKKASFPVVAAVGGMIVPALLYTMFNPHPPQSTGWAIPMATDIAIAIGVLGLLGRAVPNSLRVFLLALAIIDDVGSILVIGLFYSQPTNMFALVVAILLSVVLLAIRNQKYWAISFILVGVILWYCLLLAGVSGTMAGVIIAALMPLSKRRSNAKTLQTSEVVEDVLIPVTSFVIVPLFVFANAGLDFSNISLLPGDGLMVFCGVAAGLLIGKPLGILVASWVATKIGLTHKPSDISWQQIGGIGLISGIGFTISLLITDLSFDGEQKFQDAATLGVFIASLFAGMFGLNVLRMTSKKV